MTTNEYASTLLHFIIFINVTNLAQVPFYKFPFTFLSENEISSPNILFTWMRDKGQIRTGHYTFFFFFFFNGRLLWFPSARISVIWWALELNSSIHSGIKAQISFQTPSEFSTGIFYWFYCHSTVNPSFNYIKNGNFFFFGGGVMWHMHFLWNLKQGTPIILFTIQSAYFIYQHIILA